MFVCCILLFQGVFNLTQKGNDKEDSEATPSMISPPEKEEEVKPSEVVVSPIDEMIDQMTLEEKVGQLLMVGVEGIVIF